MPKPQLDSGACAIKLLTVEINGELIRLVKKKTLNSS
jgi:hypothetical protein